MIESRFKEWAGAKDPLAARIAVFEHIRDIPYAIVPELRDPHTGPEGILKLCRGSCVPKHFLLGLLFAKMGIPVKYASYIFNWDDKQIQYPPDLRKLTQEMPLGAHLACRVLINEKWVLVDATWDPPLKEYGFPVNERWDGLSDCQNAVIPIKEIIHESLDARVRYAEELRQAYTEKEKQAYASFTPRLNDWLMEVRSGAGDLK